MASATGMTTRRGKKRNNSGDTIEVKQKNNATITISDNSENESNGARVMRSATRKPSTTAGTNRPWGREGKAPAQAPVKAPVQAPVEPSAPAVQQPAEDAGPVPGDEDWVEEYDFTNEVEVEDTDDEDIFDDDDALDSRSVITLSSEASEDGEYGLSERPWKDFTQDMRYQWEIMYSTITSRAMQGSWEVTEDFQREKDNEMCRYLDDFPLTQWVIPKEQASQAYFRMLERTRWRSLGIRIYGRERLPEWPPGNVAPGTHRAAEINQQPLPVPRDSYPRENPRPASGPPAAGQYPTSARPPHMQTQHAGPSLPPPRASLPSQPHAQPIPVPPGVIHQGPQGPQGPQRPPGPPPPQGPPGPHGPQGPHGTVGVAHGVHPTQIPTRGPQGPQVSLPPGIGRPIGPPQTSVYGMQHGWPPGHMVHPTNFPTPLEQPKPRKGKERREISPPASTPPPPPPTPPYALRKKPLDKKATVSTSKAGRKSARRQAEAEEFPWTRELNFAEEKANAKWDDGVYDAETLQVMEATRQRNVPIIDELDAKVQEQQRLARAAKKNQKISAPLSDDGEGKKEKKKREGRKGESGGDPYHSGAFAFASSEDETYANGLGFKTPEEALEAGGAGKLEPEKQAKIKICWNPGKKGTTENLEQVKFSVRDTLATRKQLDATPILTKRAAECIIDFCPDMLWRGMLLRITSEAGWGNKDVRDRFCYNGCYCDKATITKRISAALGQKQIQPKSRGYLAGELEWYDANVKDFTHYIDYFGKRSSHRNMLKITMQNERRKQKQREETSEAKSDGEGADGEASKSRKDKDGDEMMDDGDDGDEDGHESDATDDSNAVSIQDSDILDKMED
ncbi:hypothetical protein PRZ48_000584 [Zasmidium cellare]|uniref:Uncharacterized protein n=1 Tax=Zasmidium cellare TaxID=395010 RepID=A0ABR0EYW3_ZASCE|nr:hypothetical protein PRZ48_000584 [Zasmidium cellare]